MPLGAAAPADADPSRVSAEVRNDDLSELIAIGQALAAELDIEVLVQSITDAGTKLTRAAFGAFFYNAIDENGGRYALYTISGVPREAFSNFAMPRRTEVFAPTFDGVGVVVSDDITRDPRYGRNAPYCGMPPGHLAVTSYLAAPVVSRSGEVLGGLFFGHPEAGIFGARETELAKGLASHAAIAIDNARLYRRAQQSIRARDEFISIAAHELRTPLTPLKIHVQMLQRLIAQGELSGPAAPRIDEASASIERQLARLSKLVEDLLDVSRIGAGTMALRCEPVPLAAVVREVADRHAAQARNAGNTIALELDDTVAWADRMRVEQIVVNLLVNAIRHAPGTPIRLRCGSRGDRAWIEVADAGPGVPAELVPRLFERFETGRPAGVEAGLGLGLYIARRLALAHGGDLCLQQPDGKGACFVVELPASGSQTQP